MTHRARLLALVTLLGAAAGYRARATVPAAAPPGATSPATGAGAELAARPRVPGGSRVAARGEPGADRLPALALARDPTLAAPPVATLAGARAAQTPAATTAEALSPAEERNRGAVHRAAAGDTEAAVTLLREAHALAPENDLYARNLQAALINAGFAAIDSAQLEVAVARLQEALALGDRGEIRRGLGHTYYRLGRLDLARTSLEQALQQGAADGETLVTLGRIYLERREQRRALALFEEALAAGAAPPGLAETVARLRRDAETERTYETLASSHFVVKFEGREHAPAARLVANALEDAHRRVGARFAYYPLERLEVVVYPDETFRAVTDSPHWSGGIYDGRIKLPIGGLARGGERLARTLRHEYAHAAIVTLSRGRAPVWLNEGLAQVAEETGDEGRANRVRMALAAGDLIPLAALEGGFTGLDRARASLAYAEAYFAARYLLESRGSYNVRRLLEAMATAESTDAALRQALSLPYEELARLFLAALPRLAG